MRLGKIGGGWREGDVDHVAGKVLEGGKEGNRIATGRKKGGRKVRRKTRGGRRKKEEGRRIGRGRR